MSQDSEQYAMFEAMVRGGMTPKVAFDMFRNSFGDEPAKAVLARHEQKVGLIRLLKDPITFTQSGLQDWYAGPTEADRFWPALESYLRNVKGWEPEVIQTIDSATTKILSLMQPPNLGRVDTKGLVVGYVQSGKTANYTALMAKAADVGYRLFIVLSGIHNSLRRQTEMRLRKELVALSNKHWATLTSPQEDFRPSVGNTNAFLADGSHLKILCVVKKNAAVLRRLMKWLEAGEPSVLASCPVLIIDDEADQAGLNASKDPEVRTVINSYMLRMVNMLPKVAYVGYTATPFANVLVNPAGNDLYPSSFIASLPRPKGYFGSEALFGRMPLDDDDNDFESEGLDMIRTVPEEEIPHLRPRGTKDRGTFEATVTDSLGKALDYFLLACAARRLRGAKSHASMLVHTTLYADSHETIAAAVVDYCKDRQRSLAKKKKSVLARLRELWEDESPRVPAAHWGHPTHSFDVLAELLVEVGRSTRVIVENNQSLDRLTYGDEPETQIVVGGNTLSRGLTLEGLMVSFFVRSASAYDTLLQMGRWFGYRFGYEDLPRIWMTDELKSSFVLLATVEQEVRNDIARYDAKALTPRDFGVRIRTHPGLAITSRLKMQSAIDCNLSYAAQTHQTRFFRHDDRDWLRGNQKAAQRLLAKLEKVEDVEQYKVYRDVPVTDILVFLNEYKIHENHPALQFSMLGEYLKAQNAKNALLRWNVAVVQRKEPGPALGTIRLTEELELNLVSRSRRNVGTGEYADLGTISTQAYFNADLDAVRRKNRNEKRTVDDDPLLVIIPISCNSRPDSDKGGKNRVALDAVEDIIGLAFSFPAVKSDTPQKYVTVDLSKVERDEEEEYVEEEDE